MKKNNLPSVNLFASVWLNLASYYRYFLFVFCFSAVSTCFSQVYLLDDLNQPGIGRQHITGLTDVNGTLYFISNGKDLWKSDGTEAGTELVYSFERLNNLANVSGTLFMNASSAGGYASLWKSDGTALGTAQLKDVYPEFMTDVNGTLYFVTNTGATGRELWKSDGTTAGTVLVKDIMRVVGNSNPSNLTNVNGTLFFVANDAVHGYELWKSDGTATGTNLVKDIRPASKVSSFPDLLMNMNGLLYFTADDGVTGRELWKSDGTALGTVRVKDIRPGALASFPTNLTQVGSVLYFTAYDGTNGNEIWKTDGTESGTSMLKDIAPGNMGTGMEGYGVPLYAQLINYQGTLYFLVCLHNGYELWKTDGTSAGTVSASASLGQDFRFMSYFKNIDKIPYLNVWNEFLYMTVIGTTYEKLDLWRTDGTSPGTVKLIDAIGDYYNYGSVMPEIKGSGPLVFGSSTNLVTGGSKLFATNGYPSSVVLVKDGTGSTASSFPSDFMAMGGNTYFITHPETDGEPTNAIWMVYRNNSYPEGVIELAGDIGQIIGVNGVLYFTLTRGSSNQLWRSPGYSFGTRVVKDLGNSYGAFVSVVNVNGTLFFTMSGSVWKSDGTEAGTVLVKNLDASVEGSAVSANGNLYFLARSAAHGAELWKSDGTEAGTIMLKDINPGAANAFPQNFVVFNDQLYFLANDGTHGMELWTTNGTTDGTIMVKDFRTGDAGVNDVTQLVKAGNYLYLAAEDDTDNLALWKSNGTTAGTIKISNFTYDYYEGMVIMDEVNGKLVFIIDWNELWVSDGTAAGTYKIKDVPQESYESEVLNNMLYFRTGSGPNTFWQTDGRSCGTRPVDFSGPFHSLTTIGDKMYFSGFREDIGWEPFYLSRYGVFDPCARSGETVAARNGLPEEELTKESGDLLSHSPNPFVSDFHLLVNGREGSTYNASIYSVSGSVVEEHSGLLYNRAHAMGEQWKPGVYILKVQEERGLTTKKVIKSH